MNGSTPLDNHFKLAKYYGDELTGNKGNKNLWKIAGIISVIFAIGLSVLLCLINNGIGLPDVHLSSEVLLSLNIVDCAFATSTAICGTKMLNMYFLKKSTSLIPKNNPLA